MWVRPGRKTQYQKTTRPPDCLPEYWATIGQHKQRQEIVKWQQRKKDIDEAIAKRTLPRVPVDPSGMLATVIALQHNISAASEDDQDDAPSLVDPSNDDVITTPLTDSDADTDQSDKDNIEFCELCHKPAWLHTFSFNKK